MAEATSVIGSMFTNSISLFPRPFGGLHEHLHFLHKPYENLHAIVQK